MYLDDRAKLSPGMLVPGEYDSYEIEAFLGLGLTAQVYRARGVASGRVVALKMLRHDASVVSTEHFWHEAQVLRELQKAGIAAAPALYERYDAPGADFQFLALEYVDGAHYEALVERAAPLPEQEALEVARQALTVLRVLHEQVGRTYTDMQLKNFYWDGAQQQLKILDWNHVSTQRGHIQPKELQGFGVATFEALAQRDVARFGAYLYRFLTGKGALERGETAWALGQRAGEQWERLSVAARQLVQRALHPDPARRYATAGAFLAGVTALQAQWRAEVDVETERQALDDLLEAGKEATPEQPEALAALDEVAARLDLLARRGGDLPGYGRRLERLTQGVSATWGSGKLYYEAAQYAQATQLWEPEAAAQGRVELQRWVVLAQTGGQAAERFAEVRAALEGLVQALEKHDLERAGQHWDGLRSAHPWVAQAAAPVRVLGLEIEAVRQVAAGKAAEGAAQVAAWERAAAAYAAAARALEAIPYAGLLREVYGWQELETWVERLEERIERHQYQNTQTAGLRAALEEDFPMGLQQVQAALRLAPEAPAVLGVCETYAGEQELLHPERALALVDVAMLYGRVTAPDRWVQRRRELSAAVQHQQVRAALEQQAQEIAAAVEAGNWGALPELGAGLPGWVHDEPWYAELVARVTAAYQFQLQQSLWAARLLHELLTQLRAGDAGARAAELQAREVELKTQSKALDQKVRALQDQESELRQQIAQTAEEQLAAEQARKAAEAQASRLQTFRDWADKQYRSWQALRAARGVAAYPDILSQVDAALYSLEGPYQDLANEKLYQDWRGYYERQKAHLEQQIANHKASRERLATARGHLSEAQRQGGMLTPEALRAAQLACDQAEALLAAPHAEHHEKDHERFQAWAETLGELLQTLAQPEVLSAIHQAQAQEAEFNTLVKQDPELPDLLAKVRLWATAWGQVRAGFGRVLWPQARRAFPPLAEMDQRVVEWETAYPLSKGGQSLEVVLTASLDSESFAHVQDALATTRDEIATKTNSKLESLHQEVTHLKEEIDSLKSVSERAMQLEQGAPVWLRWIRVGGPVVLAILLLIGFGQLLTPVNSGIENLEAASSSLTQNMVGLKENLDSVRSGVNGLEEKLTQIQQDSKGLEEKLILIATQVTEPPTSTVQVPEPPSSPPVFAGAALDWADITLYDMPPLTLTAASGWMPALRGNEVQIVDPNSRTWSVDLVFTDAGSDSVTVTGTWTLSGTIALWNPVTPTLHAAGEYSVMLRCKSPEGELQETQADTFSLGSRFDVAIKRVEFIDPGNIPEMIGYYVITNTGNVENEVLLSFVNLNQVISVALTITATNGISDVAVFPRESGVTLPDPITVSHRDEIYQVDEKFSTILPSLLPGEGLAVQAHFYSAPSEWTRGLFVLTSGAGKESRPVIYYEGFGR
ncbi:MAG: hypothetical protein JXA21_13190 [Anaerolineae bacterium]|nr:hypothetical protein [Anaerolineae bacterium]